MTVAASPISRGRRCVRNSRHLVKYYIGTVNKKNRYIYTVQQTRLVYGWYTKTKEKLFQSKTHTDDGDFPQVYGHCNSLSKPCPSNNMDIPCVLADGKTETERKRISRKLSLLFTIFSSIIKDKKKKRKTIDDVLKGQGQQAKFGDFFTESILSKTISIYPFFFFFLNLLAKSTTTIRTLRK